MKALHEINPESLGDVMKNGLVRTSRGDKGDNEVIAKTDRFLDKHRPQHLKDRGVSRDDNLYAYVFMDDTVIDITDGSRTPVEGFIVGSEGSILELSIDPDKCFVSDLDAYDELKSAIERGKDQDTLEQLARNYWSSITHLPKFEPTAVRRPEIMITYDLPPEQIKVLR